MRTYANDDEGFDFFFHELFHARGIDLPKILIYILTSLKCALTRTVYLSGHVVNRMVTV